MFTLKTFSAVFFAHPIARCSVASKPRDCGFETYYFFSFPIVKNYDRAVQVGNYCIVPH